MRINNIIYYTLVTVNYSLRSGGKKRRARENSTSRTYTVFFFFFGGGGLLFRLGKLSEERSISFYFILTKIKSSKIFD